MLRENFKKEFVFFKMWRNTLQEPLGGFFVSMHSMPT
jgi:hypothetical protein